MKRGRSQGEVEGVDVDEWTPSHLANPDVVGGDDDDDDEPLSFPSFAIGAETAVPAPPSNAAKSTLNLASMACGRYREPSRLPR